MIKILQTLWLIFSLFFSGYILANNEDYCPQIVPPKEVITQQSTGEYTDYNRDIKDLSTEIIVKNFFTSPQMFFNFLKLVYGNIDSALNQYKELNGLHDTAVFLLFKGGNVLRMVANEFFTQLPMEPREVLKNFYEPYFQRSDADFAVFIDNKLIGNMDFKEVMANVMELVSYELSKIRDEFLKHPEKYFAFVELDKEYGAKELEVYLDKANKLPALNDINNEDWYGKKFIQINFNQVSTKPNLICSNTGGYDYKYEIVGQNMLTTRISEEPNWIIKSDNRAIKFPWGTDPSKYTKFNLLRLKIGFDYLIENKEKNIIHNNFPGELVDVSFTDASDAKYRSFLDHKNEEIANYEINSPTGDDHITIKAYSPYGLAEDLSEILFTNYDRPWHSGHKYFKRINRFFFLVTMEVINNFGLESKDAKKYILSIRESLNKLYKLLPINNKSQKILYSFKIEINSIINYYKKMKITNKFLSAMIPLLEDWIVKKPQSDDAVWFKEFLDVINDNLNIALEMEGKSKTNIPLDNIKAVETDKVY